MSSNMDLALTNTADVKKSSFRDPQAAKLADCKPCRLCHLRSIRINENTFSISSRL